MSGEGKVVCVTVGSGYIAFWLIKFLLQRGYTVKATVRDPISLNEVQLSNSGFWVLFYTDSGCACAAVDNISVVIGFILQLFESVFCTSDDLKKTAHLLALEGAKERLHLLKADLLEEGSFDAAVDGCEAVFHTASLYLLKPMPTLELVDPAVKGTLNVLRSCAKVPSIKRVIVTSSFAAVPYSGKTLAPDVIVDETWFSNPAVCVERKVRLLL
ncbi:hypothetical protein GH714_001843 [Hevea brasiliensis]|uniref:3-beta hydroxysteroid dehydrogenase/isomerase domain-containing protein n=1 Tax=Hevea brasiliensis TaxID=3981 RepID=A0A6A6KY25_HEVBR|nr:hypothetical protein GH714_001843 [Hevea brasiliensis]